MSTAGGAGGGGAGAGPVELEGGVEFFAVARAKHVLQSFGKTTLAQLWRASTRTDSRDEAPTARRDLIAGLRKVIEQAGNRHLTQLPSTDVLRSVAVALKVPLTRTNASKAECAKRISEYLDDNGLEYMLERLDDVQQAALCQTLGMSLVVGEDETLDRRQRTSLSIRAAINSAGLHVFMESLDSALIEQMAEELSLPLTAEPAGAGAKKRATKKDVLITRILTARQGGYQQRASAIVPVPAAVPSAGDKGKEKATETATAATEEKDHERADDEDTDDLDLDNLAQHSLDQLKAYCAEERLVVPKPRTKKNYIDAIIAHNDRLEREEQAAAAMRHQQQQPKEGSASASSTSSSPRSDANNKPRRYTMLTLVKNEGSVVAQPVVVEQGPKAPPPPPPRQEIKKAKMPPPPPPPSPARQARAAPKKKEKKAQGKKRLRDDDEDGGDEDEVEKEEAERVVQPSAAVVQESPAGDAEVNALLSSIGLAKYTAKFDAEEIDMAALRLLDEGHLVALGMPLGSRIKLLQQIGVLKADESSHDKPQQPAVKRQRTTEGKETKKKDQASEDEMEQEQEMEEQEMAEEEPKPKRSSLGKARRRSREMDVLAQQQKQWERRDEAKKRRRSFTPTQVAGTLPALEGGDVDADEQDDLPPTAAAEQAPMSITADDAGEVIDLVRA